MHQLFRCIVVALEKHDMMKRLFCLTNVLSISSRQESMRRALCIVIEKDLDYVLGDPLGCDVPSRQHSRLIADKLLGRRLGRDVPGKVFSQGRDEQTGQAKRSLPGSPRPMVAGSTTALLHWQKLCLRWQQVTGHCIHC
jgi:hypothetical protein